MSADRIAYLSVADFLDDENSGLVSRAYEASILPAQMGAALEPGYWPKPYGGVRDQSAVLCLRLTAACCCLANPPDSLPAPR